jgi:phosphoenolpyruvate carboxykinase (GTP)
MLATGTLTTLNRETHPNCYLHLSSPNDVARVEHLTFICTPEEDDAGPNNLWMDPAAAHEKMDELFEGCMQGRVMYVIPYCMGPIDSPYSRCGVEITDSAYVVANMKLMTKMGNNALQRIEKEGTFVRGLHSTGELDPDRRFIMHFRVMAPAMVATPCSARSAMRCELPVTRAARKAGSRSTC